jgi:uncharacterized protein (TIGR02996 family)
MTHEEAFLQAICDRPDDDTPRLIYADWLEDHGDPQRAEVIRVECEMATLCDEDGLPPGEEECPRFHELLARSRELWRANADRWLGRLPELFEVEENNTERGFLNTVTVSPRQFARHAAELFRTAPLVRHLFLKDGERGMRDLAARPELARVAYLNCEETRIGTRGRRRWRCRPT